MTAAALLAPWPTSVRTSSIDTHHLRSDSYLARVGVVDPRRPDASRRHGRQESTAEAQGRRRAGRAIQDRCVAIRLPRHRNTGLRAHPIRRCASQFGGNAPRLGLLTKRRKGPGVFLLTGPVYLRESQVAEVFGVNERQVADRYAAGLLQRQHLFPFPGGYGYRRLDVVRLANTPGPVATWVREQMYRERKGSGPALAVVPQAAPVGGNLVYCSFIPPAWAGPPMP
jgi:hypothetical protein